MNQAQAIEATEEERVARPLKTLATLIAKDLRQADEAAAKASLPYYRAAGEKLLEAKSQCAHGEFEPWVKRNFKISKMTAWRYMRFAESNPRVTFRSLSDFERQTTNPNRHAPPPEFAVGIDRTGEQAAELQLALAVIASGYRVHAAKLHPDKGGSTEAMAQLNGVRNALNEVANGRWFFAGVIQSRRRKQR